jgi:hypothetical protein
MEVTGVLRRRPQAAAELGMGEQPVLPCDQKCCCRDDGDRLCRDLEAGDREGATAEQRRRRLGFRSEQDGGAVLEDDADGDGADEDADRRAVAERQVGGRGNGDAEQRHQGHHQRQQDEPGGGGYEARQRHGQEPARHDEVALREVDGSGGVEHQHESQRHQCVGGAERYAVDHQLRQDHWPATASYRLATAGMRLAPS